MKEKILEILQNLRDDLDFSTCGGFISDKELDSLDIIALAGDLESAFSIRITYDMLTPENFDTIDSIEKMILRFKM